MRGQISGVKISLVSVYPDLYLGAWKLLLNAPMHPLVDTQLKHKTSNELCNDAAYPLFERMIYRTALITVDLLQIILKCLA